VVGALCAPPQPKLNWVSNSVRIHPISVSHIKVPPQPHKKLTGGEGGVVGSLLTSESPRPPPPPRHTLKEVVSRDF